jgi:4'-phosphopantetheinyl transferase
MITAAPEVSIVLCSLDQLPADSSTLDPQEIRRAQRLQSRLDRHRFLAAHAVLRATLAERLDSDPAELRFARAPCSECGQPHGRPVVMRPGGSLARRAGLQFSLSQSGGQALIAIASVPIGADIEALPDAAMCARLAALLHPREQALIVGAPEAHQQVLFTRLWCRKEAYLKGLGVGFGHEMTEGYLSSLEHTPGWRVENIDAPEGFAAAVATAD